MRISPFFPRTSLLRARIAAASGFLLAVAAAASAAVTPVSPGADSTTVGSGAGMDGAVSPTGGFAASVPLDLPSPRGSVPIPLSVVYTGSGRAGAAGQGWDVPLSYVRRSTSTWRRKPKATIVQSSNEPPVGADRVTVSLGGQTYLMQNVGGAWWPARGESFMELKQNTNEWSLKTLDNHEYIFRSSGPVTGDGTWFLAEVRDLIGGDKVVLSYATRDDMVDQCSPAHALRRLSYTFDANGTTPLYEIELAYEPDWRPRHNAAEEEYLQPCATRGDSEAAYVFDRVREDGIVFERGQRLQSIQVKARNNLQPALAPKVVRAYQFEYDRDPTTDRPRLKHVRTTGEDGVEMPTPIATYGYGALAQGGVNNVPATLTFGSPVLVPRNFASGTDYQDEMSTMEVTNLLPPSFSEEWKATRARHVLRDFTGDGLPDLVYKSGDTWFVHPNQLTAIGPSFASTPFSWSGPSEIFEQWSIRDTGDSVSARQKLVTTETWTQFVDWNGDGRLDVIDVLGGSDNEHWKVWVNRPSGSGGITWNASQVDISPLRDHLVAHGFLATSDRVPIDRARSWNRSYKATCHLQSCEGSTCQPLEECSGSWVAYGSENREEIGHTDTMSDWMLTDLNGDGFLDVVAGTIPVQYHEDGLWDGNDSTEKCTNYPEQVGNAYVRVCRFYSQQWMDAMEWDFADGDLATSPSVHARSQRVHFWNRHGAFLGINDSPFSAIGYQGGMDGRFGVARWSSGSESLSGPGITPDSPYDWQASGYVDNKGDGYPELRSFTTYYERNVMPAFSSDRETVCDGPGTNSNHFMTRQVRGEVDVDGDGLSDFISNNTVRFNVGAGYGPALPIVPPPSTAGVPDMPFDISRTAGVCADSGHNDGGIMDLDGDGHPDLLRVVDGQLWVSRLLPGTGGDAASAQRLLTIENGYGARTYVEYKNAKRDMLASHSVPFPEIVVAKVGTLVLDGSAPSLEPTYYAYGGAEMVYDPLAVSWVFPGYRRHVAMRGKRERADDATIGAVVTITDRDPVAPAGSSYVQQVSSGRVARVSQFDTNTPRDAALFLNWNGSPIQAQTTLTHNAIQIWNGQGGTNPPIAWDEALECGDLDPATGAMIGATLCKAAGLAYTKQSESWEGISAPPSLLNVLSGSLVERVDDLGRPTLVVGKGDLRRTDDDVCTNISYASTTTDPAHPSSSPFPSVVSDVVLTDCGWGAGAPPTGQPGTPQIISAVHFRYDNLPRGQVTRGLLTARDVDRYGPGGFIDSHEVEAFTYNSFGEVESATSTRNLGTVATQATWFTYDAFGATATQVGTQASDVATTLTATEASSTWPSAGSRSTDHNGLTTTYELDAFGRVKREVVKPAGGVTTTRAQYTYRDASPRSTMIETFPGTTVAGSEATATDRVRATIVLDALGRARYTQGELGSDYGNSTLISGYTVFDELGRTRYVASTFEAPLTFQPSPTMALPYGSTFVYDRLSRVTREVTAQGINETATNTSVVGDVFVRQYTYGYEDGQRYSAARGADENDASSTRFGAHDDAWSTAIGRQVRRVRIGVNGVRKDRIDQDWDRLGRITDTRRYLVPSTGVGAVVWRSTFDSLGNRLTLSEPGVSTKNFDYDEQGDEIWSWWMDGTTRRGIVSQYDGLGRMTNRILQSLPAGGTTTIESQDRMTYDVAVGGADQPASALGGRLSSVETIGVGKTFFAYDAFGRTASTSYRYTGHNELIREAATYAAGGRLTRIDLSTPRVIRGIDYRYDSAGRTRRIDVNGSSLFNAESVSPKGQYRSVLYGNGVRETFNYAMGGPEELLDWSAATTSGTYKSQNLSYDGAGRVTMEVHQTPTSTMSRSYKFDDLGRVTQSVQSGGVGAGTEDYTHDPLGNVLTRTATTGTATRNFTYDPVDPDRLCRAAAPGTTGSCQFSYDGAGNITADLTNTALRGYYFRYFTYDAANRILSARRTEGTVTFTYGPAGRARTVTTGSFPRTIWHFGDLIEDVRPTGTTTVRTTFSVPGPLGIVASLRFDSGGSAATVYSHGDPRGNRFFTDSLGRVMQESVYSLFGRLLGAAPDNTSLSYTDDLWNGGDYFPEVGVSILGARAYDAETGRFLERDPIMNTRRATTANPYTFAFNDPANLTDPSGMDPPYEDPTPLQYVPPSNCVMCTGPGAGPSGGAVVDGLPGAKGVAPVPGGVAPGGSAPSGCDSSHPSRSYSGTPCSNIVPPDGVEYWHNLRGKRSRWQKWKVIANEAMRRESHIDAVDDASIVAQEDEIREYCESVGNSDAAACAKALRAFDERHMLETLGFFAGGDVLSGRGGAGIGLQKEVLPPDSSPGSGMRPSPMRGPDWRMGSIGADVPKLGPDGRLIGAPGRVPSHWTAAERAWVKSQLPRSLARRSAIIGQLEAEGWYGKYSRTREALVRAEEAQWNAEARLYEALGGRGGIW